MILSETILGIRLYKAVLPTDKKVKDKSYTVPYGNQFPLISKKICKGPNIAYPANPITKA